MSKLKLLYQLWSWIELPKIVAGQVEFLLDFIEWLHTKGEVYNMST